MRDLLRRGAEIAVERVTTAAQFVRKSGLLHEVRLAGVWAALRSRGRANAAGFLRIHAANDPHRTALVYRDRAWSYFELDRTVDRVAAGLASQGVRRGDAVLIALRNVPELVFAQAAAARIGASAVTVSWRSTAAELRYLVDHAAPRLVICDEAIAPSIEVVVAGTRLADAAFCVGGASALSPFDALYGDPQAVEDASDEAAVVIYTSGTTGQPKGAVRRFDRGAAHPVMGFLNRTPMAYGQTHLTACPLYHSTAFGFTTLALALASRVVLLEHFEPVAFVEAIERHRVEHTAVVPTMLHRTLEHFGAEGLRNRDLGSLLAIFSGGAPLSGALAMRALDAFGPVLYNFYGATETGLVTVATPDELRAAPGTIGLAIAGNEIRLLDEAGREVPAGEVGELYVRSKNLVAGYHRDAGATNASMREGFFSVGDLARRDARGFYFIEGRKRDMIISGGVNVYPREIEATLAEHPAVGEAAVVGVADDEWGERVHAVVELCEGATATEEELLVHCRERLAGPKRPRSLSIVERLPRNPTGKVLKKELLR
jgi:acyl-CoA synthetase (AMP-forming)/AMP-acid ligase II